jgi:hypothetical protein
MKSAGNRAVLRLDRLHQHAGFHAIEQRQVGVQHHPLFAQRQDADLDMRLQRRGGGRAHRAAAFTRLPLAAAGARAAPGNWPTAASAWRHAFAARRRSSSAPLALCSSRWDTASNCSFRLSSGPRSDQLVIKSKGASFRHAIELLKAILSGWVYRARSRPLARCRRRWRSMRTTMP